MKKINEFINGFVNNASLKRALIVTAVFLVLLYLIDFSPIGEAGLHQVVPEANLMDYECNYTVDEAYSMLDQMTEVGREFHLTKIMPLDIFFPMGLMLFGSCWMSLFLKKLTKVGNPLRLLIILPVINMLCDWGENIGITTMLMNFPTISAGVCAYTGTISFVKFIFVGSVAVSLVVLLIAVIVKALLPKKSVSTESYQISRN